MCHTQLLEYFQNREYVENVCNDIEKPLNFACRKWFNQLN